MSEKTPTRRSRPPREEPTRPSGYRASRRRSKGAKRSLKAIRFGRVRKTFETAVKRFGRGVTLALGGLAGLLGVLLVLLLLVNGVNAGARWLAARRAAADAGRSMHEKARDNLLVIGVKDKQAAGLLAVRYDRRNNRIFGIAIPDGAFVEVPGQGFERIGDSYKGGARVSLAAVQNYLQVPFENYVVVDAEAYRTALKSQSLASLLDTVVVTNMATDTLAATAKTLGAVPEKSVALAPLPVRPIQIGSQTYYEPQKAQVADLLFSWWGVKPGQGTQPLRVILYNGSGVPGIAGAAAEQLIKQGVRVVDTSNADRFDYKQTQIVLLRGAPDVAIRVRDILGVGKVTQQVRDQNIADVIVIIGKDYVPAARNG